MNRILFTLTAITLISLAGCKATVPVMEESKPVTATPAATPAAKPALSEAATNELALAEADVKAAKAHGSLWTTTVDALKKAKEAATAFDSAAVIKNARIASEQAKLSIEQTKYPSTK